VIGHFRCLPFLNQFQFKRNAPVAEAVTLVGNQVAHGINHQVSFSFSPDGLNHMGVGTDNHICSMFKKEGGQLPLLGIFTDLVFISPVHGDNGKVRFGPGRFLQVLPDLLSVDPVHNGRWRGLQPVGTVGVIEQGYPDRVFLAYQGVGDFPGGGVAKGACMQ